MVGVGDVFRALADPTRRLILDELTDRDGQSLFELCTRLITKHGLASTRQAVSQHLDVLEDAGLITVRRAGRYKFHDLDTRPIEQAVARSVPVTPGFAELTRATTDGRRGVGLEQSQQIEHRRRHVDE